MLIFITLILIMKDKVKTILLNAEDNVVACTQSLAIGDEIWINDVLVTVKNNVGIGHKLASKHINKNDLIIKYGVPIGTAIDNIELGEHVHIHNMKSNYIPTFLND